VLKVPRHYEHHWRPREVMAMVKESHERLTVLDLVKVKEMVTRLDA
jgi:hypothetical protein